uniref:MSV199 domain-containing protein n=1 Tax=viral metagenome TaxID=1070528 RepID=A0A6C0ET93_9ZZZZ
MSKIDIVELIEQNPITKLNGDYHNKLITKIKETFNDTQQQMFVASFYCYLNCDKKNDFIIDLDNVWKWLGFNQKVKAKILLENHFILNKDYTKSLSHTGKQTTHTKGGQNKELFMLNIDTFKKFCLKAGTKKADEVHEYYIKLEETLHQVIQEESNELKLQLENYKNQQVNLQNQIVTNEKDKLVIREKTILQQFPNNTQCVYYGIIDNVSNQNEKLIKFGNSNNLKNRVYKHKDTYSNFYLVNAFKVDNKLQIENAIKDNKFFNERIRNITLKNKKYIELLCIDNVTFSELDKIIKEIITSIEYSPENYIKILQENTYLKKKLEIKNENNNTNDLILLQSENTRLKVQNIKLMKKISAFKNNPNYHLIIESIQKEDIENYIDTTNQLKQKMYSCNILNKNKEGKYFCNDIVYDSLIGSREDVWNCKAYKTSGGLIKEDFILNHKGKIVSKKKSISEYTIDRFKLHGINTTTQ